MIRFLHAADIHLDSPLKGLERYEGAPVARIRGATRKALQNLVDLAIAEQVQFVLLAGDLYDGDWPDYNTGLHLVRGMARLREAGIQVFLIQGNHDAANRMTRCLKLPDNVHQFSTERPETKRLEHLAVSIHGQGFASAAVTEDLSANYPAGDRGHLNIGLLHTCADGLEGHDRYAPCTVAGLARKGYDYWALGHIHKRQSLGGVSSGLIEFPGNTQGRHVRETGPKGCLLVTGEPGGPLKSDFRRLDVVRWEECDVSAEEAPSLEEITNRMERQISSLLEEESEDRLLAVRVRLVGPCPIHDRIASDPLRCVAELRARGNDFGGDRLWIESVKIRTRPPSDGDRLLMEGTLGDLMTVLEEIRGECLQGGGLSQEFAEIRRKLPPELVKADLFPVEDPGWINVLLDEVESTLRGRLLSVGEVD